VFDDCDHAASLFALQSFGNIYSRLSNPTVAALEEKIANLEGGRGATCTSSGHAAQLLTLFTLMQPGDKLVSSGALYGGSITQFSKTFPNKFGWQTEFVDLNDFEAVRRAVADPMAKALWMESVTNPGGGVYDIQGIADIAHEAGVPLIVDNTMASP
jgi:O-acetylhomoserine (thiol)-lyase